MLENAVRPRSSEGDEPLGPPPEPGPPEQQAPRGDLRTIQAIVWSIYDFVTSQSIGRSNDYNDIVEIKQDVSEIRSGTETIIGLLGQRD